MFEFHGWFAISESPRDIDEELLATILERIKERLEKLGWESSAFAELLPMNGQYFLYLAGNPNHRGLYGSELDELLSFVATEAPGSYGLLYWRDDENDSPPGPSNFHVRVMARGSLVERFDPFLSPTIPTLADEWEPGME